MTQLKQFDFVPNANDNSHCFQSALRMAVSALSGEDITEPEAEDVTKWVHGRPTWPYMGMLALAERGLVVESTEYMDVAYFSREPEAALAEMIDDKPMLHEVIQTADLRHESEAAARCVAHPNVIQRQAIPVVEDIRDAIARGGVVICNVNARALEEVEGYAGHFVVVSDLHGDRLVVQNPGLPPRKDQVVNQGAFELGWYYPNRKLGNMIAVFPSRT
jgi:hypothetical protein